MKLQEVFDQLSNGEFVQLSIGGASAGVIDDTNYARVLGHVNLGITALYKRFSLKEGRLTLVIQPGLLNYKLTSAYAISNTASMQPSRYIQDSASEPFTDDIIKIGRVVTDAGVELGLNDAADAYSVFTPSALALSLPAEVVTPLPTTPPEYRTNNLVVVYWASHPKILMGTGAFDPNQVNLELPETHLEALLYYVASRVHTPIGMTNEFNASNNYYAKYEAACQALETKGLQVDQDSQNSRLVRNGWV
jgi:hypothetical protein